MSINISHTTRSYPNLPYEKIKNDVLGKKYSLSLIFIGTRRAKELNHVYRHASYVPNVLSFPLGKEAGEIYITPKIAEGEAKLWHMSKEGYITFLFIHGLLHLKGHHHGATMEKAEKKYMSRFGAL